MPCHLSSISPKCRGWGEVSGGGSQIWDFSLKNSIYGSPVRHLAWHVKLNEAKAKRALERESRKSSTSKEEEKKVQAKTSNLLLVNTIVNDIVLDVTATDNLS